MSDDKLTKQVEDIFSNEFDYQPKYGGGGDIYLKFNDWDEREQTSKIRIVTPTHTRLEFRDGDTLVDTSQWDNSDMVAATKDPDYRVTQKFSWVVLVRNEDGTSTPKVYEAGTGVYKKIQAIALDKEWQPLSEVDLKITRKGIKKDARYDVTPSPVNRGKLSEEEFAIADEVITNFKKYLPQAIPLKEFIKVFGE